MRGILRLNKALKIKYAQNALFHHKNRPEMRVVILTEAGKGIGSGHLSRCCAISDAFESTGIIPEFIVNADKSIKGLLKGKKYKIFNWLVRQEKLIKLIKNADISIIDSYKAGLRLYKKISGAVKFSLYLDDNNRLSYPNGIVTNGSLYGGGVNYPRKGEMSYLLGGEYALLRKEFWKVPGKKINRMIKKVLITFGGNDPRNMTTAILRFLNKEHPEFIKTVVVGSGFGNIAKIKQLKDKKTNLILFPDAGAMKVLMLDNDIAISAGGQTLYELARAGIPALCIAVAKNQLDNLRGFENAGYIENLGLHHGKALLSRLRQGLKKLIPLQERIKRHKAAKGLIDGKGAQRVAREVISRAGNLAAAKEKAVKVRLRKARKDDCYDLWVWRNHPEVRRWSFNTDRIEYGRHRKWFAEKNKDNHSNLYIMENSLGEKIGQVRFEMDKSRIAYVNANLNPKFLRMGLGNTLLKKGAEFFARENPGAEEVRALIIKENIVSKKAFQKAGYKFSHNSLRGDKRIAVFKLEV